MKKLTSKLLIMLLIVIMLIPNTTIVFAAETTIDTFSDYTDTTGNAGPSGWENESAGNPSSSDKHHIRSATDEDGNLYAQLSALADRSGAIQYRKSVSGISGNNWGVKFRFRTTNLSCDESIFAYHTGDTFSYFYIKGDGKFGGLGNNTGTQNNIVETTKIDNVSGQRVKVENNKWQDITIVSYDHAEDGQRLALYIDNIFSGYRKASDLGVSSNLTAVDILLSAGSSAKLIDITSGFDDIYAFTFEGLTLTDDGITNNAEEVPVNSLKLVFSNPMFPTTKNNILLKDMSGNTIEAFVTPSADMKTFSINPTVPLTKGTDYKISIAESIDLSESKFSAQEIKFTTETTKGVVSSEPVHNIVSDGIKITFNVSNQSENPANLFAFAGLYAGDKLIDTAMQKISDLSVGDNIDVVLNTKLQDGVFDYKVKTFLWDSVKLSPLNKITEKAVNTQPTLFIAGDSIAQSSNNTPKSGWVQHLDKFFNSSLKIANRAIGGQSSRSYYEGLEQDGTEAGESPWQSLLEEAQAGDYVAIQFGHNDTKSQTTSVGTDPKLDIDDYDPANKIFPYKYYLSRFIEDAKAKGVNPILVSSVSSHDSTGSYYPVPFADYANAMVEVGSEFDVPVLNLNTRTAETLFEYGRVNDKLFYLILEKGAFTNWPDGSNDNQHLRDYGGIYVSYLFRDELMKTNSTLKDFALSTYSQEPSLFLYDRFNTDITLKQDTDGTILVPVKDVAEGLGATYQLSDSTVTITYPASIIKNAKTDVNKVITATVDSNTDYKVNNIAITTPIEYAPKQINGEIYINPFFFKDVCGSDVYYNEFMKMTTILTGVEVPVDPYIENFDTYVGSAEAKVLPNTTNWQDNGFTANAAYVIAEKVGTNSDGSDNMAAVMHTAANKFYQIDLKNLNFYEGQQIDLRVKPSTNNLKREIRLGVQNSSAGSVYAQCIIFNTNGTISGLGSSLATPLTYSADWINIRIKALVVNDPGVAPTARVRAYVVENGVEKPICGEYKVPDGKASGKVDGLRFIVGSNSVASEDTFFIDDITVKPLDFVQSEWQN